MIFMYNNKELPTGQLKEGERNDPSLPYERGMIYFDNDTSTDYLSRNYKKNLRDLIWD